MSTPFVDFVSSSPQAIETFLGGQLLCTVERFLSSVGTMAESIVTELPLLPIETSELPDEIWSLLFGGAPGNLEGVYIFPYSHNTDII